MKARTFSTVILAGVTTLLVIYNCMTPLFIMGSLLCLAALWEFYKMAENKGVAPFKKTAMVFAALMMAVNYPFSFINLEPSAMWATIQDLDRLILRNEFVLALLIVSVLGVIALKKIKNNSLAKAAVTIFGFLYIPFLFTFLMRLVWWQDGLLMVIYVVAVTKCTDIGAYLVGSWIGKHKMSPQTSPKKTWEGFVGGILLSLTVSLVFVHFLLPQVCWGHALILGLILPPLSVIGDLVESVIKRDTEIKDSGAFIPGIGGALDLIDSVLFTAPVFYFYLIIIRL